MSSDDVPLDDLPEQVRVRRDKYDRLVAAGTPPYSLGYPRTATLAEVRERFGHLEIDTSSGATVGVTGRVVLSRAGGKLCFATLQEGDAMLQVMVSLDRRRRGAARRLEERRRPRRPRRCQRRGHQQPARRAVSILASDWQLTSKALRPLPDKHKGLTDPEARVRQRYVDLIVNPTSRQMVRDRATVVRSLRETLRRARLPRGRDAESCSRCTAARRRGRSRPTSTRSTST